MHHRVPKPILQVGQQLDRVRPHPLNISGSKAGMGNLWAQPGLEPGGPVPLTGYKLSFSLLRGRASDGFPVYQEKVVRESIRKFPYCEATLLQQLVRSIAPVEIVSSLLVG